jgi:hypothetical protein
LLAEVIAPEGDGDCELRVSICSYWVEEKGEGKVKRGSRGRKMGKT